MFPGFWVDFLIDGLIFRFLALSLGFSVLRLGLINNFKPFTFEPPPSRSNHVMICLASQDATEVCVACNNVQPKKRKYMFS